MLEISIRLVIDISDKLFSNKVIYCLDCCTNRIGRFILLGLEILFVACANRHLCFLTGNKKAKFGFLLLYFFCLPLLSYRCPDKSNFVKRRFRRPRKSKKHHT